MCNLVEVEFNTGTYRVADIKSRYVLNIAKSAQKCKGIDKVVLFGSSIDESCTENSDIDIAVFGNKTRSRYTTTREFHDFLSDIFKYDYGQDYDILYFETAKTYKDRIMQDINEGVVIYARA